MRKNSEAVFLFDGQGSQYYGMGKDLYDASPCFRNTLLELDAAAYRVLGHSVIEHIYCSPGGTFEDIRLSHPAIYMIQYALGVTLQEEFDIHPVHVLGNNLGEAVAAAVSGAVDPLDMLAAVIGQAAALDGHCARGGLITVLQHTHWPDADPLLSHLYEAATLVAIHRCGHITLSAGTDVLYGLKEYFGSRGIAYRQMPGNRALHSPLMDAAQASFLDCSRHLVTQAPAISFISGVHAREIYQPGPYYWWQTMREQSRFSDAIRLLESEGRYFFIDCSPAGGLQPICEQVLSGRSGSAVFGIMNDAHKGLENLQLLQRRPDLSLPLMYRNSL